MNKFLAVCVLIIILALDVASLFDSHSLLFEFVSVGQGAVIVHVGMAMILAIISLKGHFNLKMSRYISGVSGTVLLLFALLNVFYPVLQGVLKPYDYLFVVELGIILSLAGWGYEAKPELLNQSLFTSHYKLKHALTFPKHGGKVAYS